MRPHARSRGVGHLGFRECRERSGRPGASSTSRARSRTSASSARSPGWATTPPPTSWTAATLLHDAQRLPLQQRPRDGRAVRARAVDRGPRGGACSADVMALAQRSLAALREAYGPEGFNLGINQGKIAGAGFDEHVHLHVVPRWAGDTNFMPVIGVDAGAAGEPRGLLRRRCGRAFGEALPPGPADALGGGSVDRPLDLQGLRRPRPLRRADRRATWPTALGRAFARVLAEGEGKAAGRAARGRGARHAARSAPELAGRYVDGLRDEGADVLDVGEVGTEVLYHAVASRDLDGGLMCTASHNPKAWTGREAREARRGRRCRATRASATSSGSPTGGDPGPPAETRAEPRRGGRRAPTSSAPRSASSSPSGSGP